MWVLLMMIRFSIINNLLEPCKIVVFFTSCKFFMCMSNRHLINMFVNINKGIEISEYLMQCLSKQYFSVLIHHWLLFHEQFCCGRTCFQINAFNVFLLCDARNYWQINVLESIFERSFHLLVLMNIQSVVIVVLYQASFRSISHCKNIKQLDSCWKL